MREQNASGAQERSSKRMVALTRWPEWYYLPIGNRQRKHSSIASLYRHDRRTRTSPRSITYSQLTYRLTVVFLSAGISGIGIGQIAVKLIGG